VKSKTSGTLKTNSSAATARSSNCSTSCGWLSQGCRSVTLQQRYVYFATLLCTGISAALLIAPSSHHRLLWRQHAREKRLKAANRLSIGGLAFLALAMIGAIFLITDVLFGGVAAAVSAVGIGAVFVWYWYGQPLLSLRK
jgi:hypothetical protein